MYHKGYVEALPVQLPEVTDLIREYFKSHYNHNYICRHKKQLVDEFIEDFIPWLNQGHLKFKGLKDFRNVGGEFGYFQNKLNAYGKENKKCSRIKCKGELSKVFISGRSSFFCTVCQKK